MFVLNNSNVLPLIELKITLSGRPKLSAMTELIPKVPATLWKKSSD